jgi:hypothetical protein
MEIVTVPQRFAFVAGYDGVVLGIVGVVAVVVLGGGVDVDGGGVGDSLLPDPSSHPATLVPTSKARTR